MWTLVRQIAGTCRGPRKRQYNPPYTFLPDTLQTIDYPSGAPSQGGMAAAPFDIEAERHRRAQVEPNARAPGGEEPRTDLLVGDAALADGQHGCMRTRSL